MYLRVRVLGWPKSQVEALLLRWRRRKPIFLGWRDRYLWDTVLLIALALALCAFALWVGTHPVD
jgi:hypothetical protein